jgi:hypothetical protein
VAYQATGQLDEANNPQFRKEFVEILLEELRKAGAREQ